MSRGPATVEPRVVILAYHKIGDPPPEWWSWYYVPEDVFRVHLTRLADDGWDLLDVETFVAALADPTSLSSRSALLTFDDGYVTFVDKALPILQEFDAPSILFVPTDHVGASSDNWDRDVEPREVLCSWDDLRALPERGVSIESHGAAHRAYGTMTAEAQQEDATRSKASIEQHLGTSVRLLSYPYGDAGGPDADAAPSVRRSGYEAAFVYGGSMFTPQESDRYRLPRLTMGPETDLKGELGR